MIDFTQNLPSFKTGTYNIYESGFPCMFSTLDPELGKFIAKLRSTVREDRRLFFIDGRCIMLSLNWIRDHVHEMKAFMHWEYDLQSFLDFVIDYQNEKGYYYELIKQSDEGHHTFVGPEWAIDFPEDNLAFTRLEIEADVEYLVVEGAVMVYKVTGDDLWIQKVLPKLEKGIDYLTSDPERWDKERGLVKRAFTIDTWDFAHGQSTSNRRIDPSTPMSIMHGDNSGVYQAMLQLAWLRRRFGQEEKAKKWEERAATLKKNMFKYLWNGKFFIHQLHLGHSGIDDLESQRLSLSNTYDINRGVTTTEESRSIISEYMKRRKTTAAFAEWFSIDPPYNEFCSYKRGSYVNGGITSFTAGELSKAAFQNGYETYGWDILKRVWEIVKKDGELYFLYDPQTRENLGGGPSGWGAAALLSAIDQGLAGITDLDVQYRKIEFAPRWPVTEYKELRYVTGYELSKVMIDQRYLLTEEGMRYKLECPSFEITCHLLLPCGKEAARVNVNGVPFSFEMERVGESSYVNFVIETSTMQRVEARGGKNAIFDILVYFNR